MKANRKSRQKGISEIITRGRKIFTFKSENVRKNRQKTKRRREEHHMINLARFRQNDGQNRKKPTKINYIQKGFDNAKKMMTDKNDNIT